MDDTVADIPGEVWKDVEGYEGLYQISNMGRVKSLGNDRCKVTKILEMRYVGREGRKFCFVSLSKNSEVQQPLVHRLVAQAFIPNPEGRRNVKHLDGDIHNCRADNLVWVDRSDLIGSPGDGKTVRSRPIIQYDTRGEVVCEWKSASQAGRELGISSGSIGRCCLHKLHTAGGYIWRYKDEEVEG